MMKPNILFYGSLEYCTKLGKKTPQYKLVKSAGYYPPMEALKNKRGEILMYLLNKLKEKANAPAMWLQAKDSLNFTGIKDIFENGKLSGFAYGYPFASETYSKDNKPNPFYDYRNDGYLFVVHSSDRPVPDTIELIILEDARVLIPIYCKQLSMGGVDDELNKLRTQTMQNMLF